MARIIVIAMEHKAIIGLKLATDRQKPDETELPRPTRLKTKEAEDNEPKRL
jgi:hypothetical protein